eukprot:m51a1_g5489 hypothetical protein (147) ;mRNA; r:323804-324431
MCGLFFSNPGKAGKTPHGATPPPRPSSEQLQADIPPWACPLCKYHNGSGRATCQVCCSPSPLVETDEQKATRLMNEIEAEMPRSLQRAPGQSEERVRRGEHERLMKLLLRVDAIDCRAVRDRRKDLVGKLQARLDAVETSQTDGTA